MNKAEFKARTKQFGLRVIRLVESLPHGRSTNVIGHQLLKSGTSVGANYRSACRGRSAAEMIAKLAIVEEEADEAVYWMEMLIESGIISERKLSGLIGEADEILAMIVASIRTLRRSSRQRIQNPKSKIQNRNGHG